MDDVDKDAVLFMIKYLHHHITKHSGLDVRIFHETSVQPQNPETTDLFHYTQVIQDWNMLWNAYIELPVPTIPFAAWIDHCFSYRHAFQISNRMR